MCGLESLIGASLLLSKPHTSVYSGIILLCVRTSVENRKSDGGRREGLAKVRSLQTTKGPAPMSLARGSYRGGGGGGEDLGYPPPPQSMPPDPPSGGVLKHALCVNAKLWSSPPPPTQNPL